MIRVSVPSDLLDRNVPSGESVCLEVEDGYAWVYPLKRKVFDWLNENMTWEFVGKRRWDTYHIELFIEFANEADEMLFRLKFL